MKEALKQLREVHAIQGRDGCWDIDDYMLGLYNGLELALSIVENRECRYKDRPAAQPEQERCVGCEACIDTACGRDECPKGWPKAAQPEQEPAVFLKEWSDWRDMVVVNIMRHGSIDKHLARELANHFQSMTPQPKEPEQEPVTVIRLGQCANQDCDGGPLQQGCWAHDCSWSLLRSEQKPVGWKLVPIEPTNEMLKAMDECSTEGYDERLYAGHAASVYMAAVDVAPNPPEARNQEPVAWLHTKIEGVAVPHRPADLDKHPDRWTALYKDPKPCPTCEALARTVMLDQTSHDTTPPQRKPLTDEEIGAILWHTAIYICPSH